MSKVIELEELHTQLENAKQLFERQSERINDLEFELTETSTARDKALYYLLRFAEASKREQWPMSEEMQKVLEHAENLLFDHNIYTDLPEPDAAILHLMEVAAVDFESEGCEEIGLLQ